MKQPNELKTNFPVELSNGVISSTTMVWQVLLASRNGDLSTVIKLIDVCPELAYAQYNYAPPIHLAVREGHLELVKYLLSKGAYNTTYQTYPFQDTLPMIAQDRGHDEIETLLKEFTHETSHHKYKGDNGAIRFPRTDEQKEFEIAVDKNNLTKVKDILKRHPEFAQDETFFWGEGILMMPAKENRREMIDLLMAHGAKVPNVLKWTQFYYFEHDEGAAYMMEKGMDPNTMSCHHVTILHDMAQKGNIRKAELLLKYGADINYVDEEYQSTPLGMAARWGNLDMVKFLLQRGADPNESGEAWSTPLAWARLKEHPKVEEALDNAGAIS